MSLISYYWYLLEITLPAGRFYQFEHIASYSCGEVDEVHLFFRHALG